MNAGPSIALPPDLVRLSPVVAPLLTALAVLIVDWFRTDRTGRVSGSLSLAGLIAAAVLALRTWTGWAGVGALLFATSAREAANGSAGGLLRVDGFGAFVGAVVILSAVVTVLLALDDTARRGLAQAEFFVLVLVASAGMMTLAIANDLVILFLILETLSLALYVLCGFLRGRRASQEAALKYFVLGSAAAAFLLYGIALVYGATGTTNLDRLAAALPRNPDTLAPLLPIGLALLLVGLGFKVAMAPFHQWTPDVYQGAPMVVTAFMAAATKAAAFAALTRVLWTAFAPVADTWTLALAVLAVATMTIGNLAALVQADMKRMLAYSAVAHAGYILAAVVAGTPAGNGAVLFYLLVYAWMNLGAFAVLLAVGPLGEAGGEEVGLEDLRGLARRHAGLALAMTIFLVGLTGLPPTAGFLAKWYVLQATLADGWTFLAVAIGLNSALAAFYYLRPVLLMYLAEPPDSRPLVAPTPHAVVVATTALVVGLGIVLAGPLVERSRAASPVGSVREPTPQVTQQPPMFFVVPDFEKRGR